MTTHIHKPGDQLIGRYEIRSYIAEGGMQQVYLAADHALNRQVALKVPKTESAIKRFARSAIVSAKVVHPNVAATLDYFEVDSRSYLIEELISGTPLSIRLASEFLYLDPHLAAHVIHHIAKGVAASHHVGVFHRDLKPSNIMVSSDPALTAIKITDFGIAKMAEEELAEAFRDEESTTGSQTAMGALPYMAPEMIRDQKSAGLPADIWAVGAILYQFISGNLPFGRGLGATPRILEATLPPMPALFLTSPQFKPLTEDLWSIVSLCMRKEPAERPEADQLVKLCAKLCYSDAVRRTGTIATWKYSSWGFIAADDGEEVFFHGENYYASERPKLGARVNFADFPGSPRNRAFPVIPLRTVEAN